MSGAPKEVATEGLLLRWGAWGREREDVSGGGLCSSPTCRAMTQVAHARRLPHNGHRYVQARCQTHVSQRRSRVGQVLRRGACWLHIAPSAPGIDSPAASLGCLSMFPG